MRVRNLVMGLLFLAVFLAGGSLLVAHADSVTVNGGSTYNVTFVNVDLSANATVNYNLYYVDANNETKPFLSLSGTSFSYNATEPLILSIENTGTSAVNVTFNKLESTLASDSGIAQITPSDQVVKIPVSGKAGSQIKITVTPNGDPYPRLIAIALGYSDGTYKLVVSGDTARTVSDSDWPASLTPKCTTVYGKDTYTVTADKDVTSVIVYISTYVGHWDVDVSIGSASNTNTGTTTETTTTTSTSNSNINLDYPINIFGHQTTMGAIVIIVLVLVLLGAVLLRR